MTNYIGLDAHSKTCTAVVTDAKGCILKKQVFNTSEKELITFVNSVKRPRILAFEEMNIAQWLFVLLKDQVDNLQVAHAPHLTKQRGAKTDFNDAMRLANELRLGTITNVFHDDGPLFELRTMVKSHADFTEDLTRTKNRFKAFLRSRGIFIQGKAVYKDLEILNSLEKPNDKFIAENLMAQIKSASEIKDAYEKKLEVIAKKWPIAKNLCDIPGIAFIRATTIIAMVCSGARFPDKHKFWAYCGLVRHKSLSDGKNYGNRRIRGCRELKCAFMGAAKTVLAGNSSLRKQYDKLRTQGVSDRDAKKAIARKIAAIALMIMKTGARYDEHHDQKRSRKKFSN